MLRPLLLTAAAALLCACAPPYPGDGASTGHGEATNETAAAPVAAASVAPVGNATEAALRTTLTKTLPGVTVDQVRGTPMPGILEIRSGLNFGYVSADGRYLIEGDLNDLASGKRITEDSRKVARKALLAAIPEDQSIQFGPPVGVPAKYEITVFTDVDCGYCRMLHSHIAEYNAEGIKVRYLFFPRSGLNTESFYKAEEVWCSADRQKALTEAKKGVELTAAKDCPNPVAQHLKLAGELGLRGTPAIILPDGEMIAGYQPPAQLLQALDAMSGKAPAAAAVMPALDDETKG